MMTGSFAGQTRSKGWKKSGKAMNPLQKLNKFGQSVWYDNIQRKLIRSGELANMIAKGEIRGITSNPSIFNAAISKSTDYDSTLQPLAWAGWSPDAIFWQIAVDDIKAATDLFVNVYIESDKTDGYVSLEVNPLLAFDSEKTLADAKTLWKRVSKPNLMIKIPATKEGVVAIRKATAAGINTNATLIFSLDRYAEVIDAYLGGLADRLKAGEKIDDISSVASFFISRVDTKIDGFLQRMVNAGEIEADEADKLQGKAAIANARLAYQLFSDTLRSSRFRAIQQKGGRAQRPLWASTSSKNPKYNDVIYIEELIGKDSVNTIQPATLNAFRDHGKVEQKIEADLVRAEEIIRELADIGIEMDVVTGQLEVEGVQAFSDAYKELISSIQGKVLDYQKGIRSLEKLYQASLGRMMDRKIIDCLFSGDPEPWVRDEAGKKEFNQRTGWLDAPLTNQKPLKEYDEFRDELVKEGFQKALVIGMGGSSLAPEVFSLLSQHFNGEKHTGLMLGILDSTDPISVQKASRDFPVKNSIYIISSKSGSTAEINANFNYLWKLVENKFGEKAGSRFVAITDPGTSLEDLAKEREFRKTFHGNPSVGGRFSALTAFGLVPAALIGWDTSELLSLAEGMMANCKPGEGEEKNPGLALGTLIGTAASAGRDKLSFIIDPEIESFGSWLEQLLAESTGKQGKGILPVDLEPDIHPLKYGNDRLFIYIRLNGSKEQRAEDIISAGHPCITIQVESYRSLGAEMYRWEVATTVACAVLEINPFDQPDVQESKSITKRMIKEYKESGTLPQENAIWQSLGIQVFGEGSTIHGKNLQEVLWDFLSAAKKGNFVAINAFFPRDEKMLHEFQIFRKKVLEKTGLAVTLGFGPRFLHSTGQFHKGGPNSGYFLVFTKPIEEDIEIPGESISFGVLENAQALGDYEALEEKGRKVLRIQISTNQLKDLL
jgi:transaldolase/glucose-6-phosphate isomerase